MIARRWAAFALLGIPTFVAHAQATSWIEDWYEIEVILFLQPSVARADDENAEVSHRREKYTEDLIVPAPSTLPNVTRAFTLTELERNQLQLASAAINFEVGDDPWFIEPENLLNAAFGGELDPEPLAYRTFPEWLRQPGESYDPLFNQAFLGVSFGSWFTELALASLLPEEEEEEELDELAEELLLDQELIEAPLEDTGPTVEEVEAALADYRAELHATSFVMNEQRVRLPRTAERLRSSGVNVIKHFNWHQFVPPREREAEYVLFQTRTGTPTDGYFRVSKGRFIHLEAHLWIHQTSAASGAIEFPVVELSETRRMRRGEVHYFDHPQFGMIAEIVRLEIPSDLQDLVDSLD